MLRLEITFTGLFLFVPETKQPRRLHVLLPGTGGTTGVHLHEATMHQVGSTGQPITFGHETLRVPAGSGTILLPPSEAVDLEEITQGERFPRSALKKPNPSPAVYARVVLPLASSIRSGQTAHWHIDGLGERVLTHRIIWTLDGLPGTSVTLQRDPFGDGAETAEVFHQDAQGVVQLCIRHLPDHVHQPFPGFEADHFQAFYRSDPIFSTGPNPTLAQVPSSIDPSPCDPVDKNADTFTCMVAQVRAG